MARAVWGSKSPKPLAPCDVRRLRVLRALRRALGSGTKLGPVVWCDEVLRTQPTREPPPCCFGPTTSPQRCDSWRRGARLSQFPFGKAS
eukprot:scaffold672_cov268-Pinguiococcus_pyrenoidosus.AAC.6